MAYMKYAFTWLSLASVLGLRACIADLLPRATPLYSNSTAIAGAVSPQPTECCYLIAFGVALNFWYEKPFGVTVLTISTIVYQHKHTASTTYITITANNTYTDDYSVGDNETLDGIPTRMLSDLGGYPPMTRLKFKAVLTDDYGVTYASPTPVMSVGDLTMNRVTLTTKAEGAMQTCDRPQLGVYPNVMKILPSGFNIDYNPYLENGEAPRQELFAPLPTELRDWIAKHPNPTAGTEWLDLKTCTIGLGNGVPVAHVPVAQLTARVSTTITVADPDGVMPNPGPATNPPKHDDPPNQNPHPKQDGSPSGQSPPSKPDSPPKQDQPPKQNNNNNAAGSTNKQESPTQDGSKSPAQDGPKDQHPKKQPAEKESKAASQDGKSKPGDEKSSSDSNQQDSKNEQKGSQQFDGVQQSTNNNAAAQDSKQEKPNEQVNNSKGQSGTSDESSHKDSSSGDSAVNNDKAAHNEQENSQQNNSLPAESQVSNSIAPKPTDPPALVVGGITYGPEYTENGIVTISNDIFKGAPSVVVVYSHTTRTEGVGDIIASIMGYEKQRDEHRDREAEPSAQKSGSATLAAAKAVTTDEGDNSSVTSEATATSDRLESASRSTSMSVSKLGSVEYVTVTATITRSFVMTVGAPTQAAGAERIGVTGCWWMGIVGVIVAMIF